MGSLKIFSRLPPALYFPAKSRRTRARRMAGKRDGGTGGMNARRICLVIEDDVDSRGLLSVIFSRAGFEVHTEATGTAGLQAAAERDLALITLDLGLPDLNGHDVARAIRALSDVPLLLITASAESEDELAGMAAGASFYLTKPFRPAQLRAVVEELCPPLVVAAPDGRGPREGTDA